MCLLLPSAQLISPSATTFGRQQPLSAALTLRTQPNLYGSRLCSLFPEPLIPALASATASLRWIRVNTSAERYQEYSSDDRKESLAKGLFNVYRTALTGIWRGTPRDAVPPEGPAWLIEGSNRFLTHQVIRAPGPESCDPTRARYARIYQSADTPLSDAETYAGFNSMGSAIRYSFLAVELLAEQAGQESIIGYFASLRPGGTWQDAFQTNFGVSVAEFYQQFEERRAAGFPRPRCPTLPPLVTMPGTPEYVKWVIWPDVAPEYIEASIEGARLMHEYAESLDVPGIKAEVHFHLFHNLDDHIAVFETIGRGKPGRNDLKRIAEAGKGYIFFNALRLEEAETSLESIKKISAHEILHTLQSGLAGVHAGSDDVSVPKTGPRWLTEGIAEFLAYQALSAADILSYDTKRNSTFVKQGEYVDKPLSEMETLASRRAARGSTYTYFLLAAELLASRTGQSSLIHYYTLPQPGTTWQQAFQTTFGMTVEEFTCYSRNTAPPGFRRWKSQSETTPAGPQTADDYIVW